MHLSMLSDESSSFMTQIKEWVGITFFKITYYVIHRYISMVRNWLFLLFEYPAISIWCQMCVDYFKWIFKQKLLVIEKKRSNVQIEFNGASLSLWGFIEGMSGVHMGLVWGSLVVVAGWLSVGWCTMVVEFLWWEGLFGGPLGCMFGGSNWGSLGVCWGVPHGGYNKWFLVLVMWIKYLFCISISERISSPKICLSFSFWVSSILHISLSDRRTLKF